VVTSYVLASLPRLPELVLALIGLVLALSGRFRTSTRGLATLGWVFAVANVVFSLAGLLVVYLVIYRTRGDYHYLALNAVTNIVAMVLTLGTWACFLVVLLREPASTPVHPTPPGYPAPPGYPGRPAPQDSRQPDPPRG
jgi:hypothetical protein